ncbi:nitrogenase iron-molybdenum cofactor biosynthesis protein NifE [Desulfurobacterium atlanticum]|uniref:Nitrogenase iron-molybdenum cofactor biosynthesis protein NifE n=1 Tax=Desulfurobacterium atlanticum TaxID=240169 RepID=A0A238YQW9_9BACT|nr:nitrogenase iron-molybdenum cofactor biosynthesis protein NifE [Desulfurobacterium atlanticum]SNR73044.1 nitrogenase molybdenum-cofactor synthesis protein NifE [Desulfurobacterium atlanticum]
MREKVGMKVLSKKPVPGKAAGGCAFDGAKITLVPITDAAHLFHGAIGCAVNGFEGRKSKSSGSDLYINAFSTDLTNEEIVFGSLEKLERGIEYIFKNYKPKGIFVYNTCIPAMTGENIFDLCNRKSKELGIPVIPVDSPGFIGAKNLGTRIAAKVLFDYVIGKKEPDYTTPFDINLIGEFNVAGDLFNILPLFKKCGIRVLSTITGDGRMDEIATAHRAKLNVVFCSQAMINLAEYMEERYGIPFVQVSFYGKTPIENSLRKIAKAFKSEKLSEKVEKVIEEENERIKPEFERLKTVLKGKRAVLYTGGHKSWSGIELLRDFGIEVVLSSGRKSTAEEREKIKKLIGKERLVGQIGARKLHELCFEFGADVLIAGGRNMYPSLKSKIPYLHINQERFYAYAGYDGLIEFGRQLEITITSPVWRYLKEKPFYLNGGER